MSTDEKCTAALAKATAHLRCDSGTVHLKKGDELVLTLSAAQAIPPPVIEIIKQIPWGKGMAGLAAERVEPVGTCNLQTTQSTDVRPGAKATQLQGTLVVPMMLGDDVVGTFGVGCRGERTFTTVETRWLWDAAASLARSLAPPPLDTLRSLIAKRADASGLAWLDEQLAHAKLGDRVAVTNAFPQVSRQLGREALGSGSALVRGEDEVPLRAFRIDDAGRVAILVAFSGDRTALARDLYFSGDLREKAGALRALALVGEGGGAVDAVLDAVRVSAAELVEAALAENLYAARELPEFEWRKALLKCAFVGVTLDRLPRVATRADKELTAMLLSLVTERESAGRSIPTDLWTAMGHAPIDGLLAKLIGYLEHPVAAHRVHAALALQRFDDPVARRFLDERAARENDPSVLRALSFGLPYL